MSESSCDPSATGVCEPPRRGGRRSEPFGETPEDTPLLRPSTNRAPGSRPVYVLSSSGTHTEYRDVRADGSVKVIIGMCSGPGGPGHDGNEGRVDEYSFNRQ